MKALFAEVVNIKAIPSRGVARLEIDFPIEHFVAVTALLYSQRVLVTVAPKELDKAPYTLIEGSASDVRAGKGMTVEELKSPPPEEEKGGPLSRSAGVICNTELFQIFVAGLLKLGSATAEDCAVYVRKVCGITSRAQLDHNNTAALAFASLMRDYREFVAERGE